MAEAVSCVIKDSMGTRHSPYLDTISSETRFGQEMDSESHRGLNITHTEKSKSIFGALIIHRCQSRKAEPIHGWMITLLHDVLTTMRSMVTSDRV